MRQKVARFGWTWQFFQLTFVLSPLIGEGLSCKSHIIESPATLLDLKNQKVILSKCKEINRLWHFYIFKHFQVMGNASIGPMKTQIKIGGDHMMPTSMPSEKITKCNHGKLVAHLQKFDHQKFAKASHKMKWRMLHGLFGPQKCFQGLEQKKFRMLQNLIRSRKIMELLHGIIGKIISQYGK